MAGLRGVREMRALIEEYKKRLGRDFTDEERELMVRLICDPMFNVRDKTCNKESNPKGNKVTQTSEHIFRLKNACTVDVLRVEFVQGEGTAVNPCRLMYRFYLPNGRYIGEISAGSSSR